VSAWGGHPKPEPPQAGSSLDEVVAGAVAGLFGRDSLYMVLWGIQLVAAALVTPLMTRALDIPNFGTVAAANAVMQVVFVIAGFGLYPAIQRHYARGRGKHDSAKVLAIALLAAALVTSSADVTGPLWASHVGFAEYGGPVRLAVLWAGVSAVTNSGLALLRSQDRLLAFGTVSLLQSVVAEATSLALVLTVAATSSMFLVGQLCVQVVAAGVVLLLAPPHMPRLSDRRMVGSAIRFGLPLIPAVLCTFVINSADRLIIQSMLGVVAVARYQVAYNVGALPQMLLGVLNSSWMPRIFSFRVVHERAEVIAASRDLLYVLLMPALVGLAAGAPIVLRIWAPPQYDPDALLLLNAIVLVSAIPYTAALASTRTLMAEGRTGYIAVAQVIAAAANIGLNLLFIGPFGLPGSAAATLLSFMVLHLLLLARAKAVSPMRSPRRVVVLGLVATAAVVLTAAAVPVDSTIAARIVIVLLTLAWFAHVFSRTMRMGSSGRESGANHE
jgi:O-antigen/teichoic acid export membrane protein